MHNLPQTARRFSLIPCPKEWPAAGDCENDSKKAKATKCNAVQKGWAVQRSVFNPGACTLYAWCGHKQKRRLCPETQRRNAQVGRAA